MGTTEWYPPEIKPVRVGWYEAAAHDCGWLYEWRVWWDGRVWRDSPNGWELCNQRQSWRGLTAGQTT